MEKTWYIFMGRNGPEGIFVCNFQQLGKLIAAIPIVK
jgi:hypothetical protein